MEAPLEADQRRPPGVGLGELHRVLHGFRAGVEQRHLPPLAHPRHQPLGQLDVGLVRDHGEVGVGEPPGLPLDRLDHLRVGVPDQLAPQSAREVEHRVAVHVRERGTASSVDHGGHVDVEGVADHLLLASEELARALQVRGQPDGGHRDPGLPRQVRQQPSIGGGEAGLTGARCEQQCADLGVRVGQREAVAAAADRPDEGRRGDPPTVPRARAPPAPTGWS